MWIIDYQIWKSPRLKIQSLSLLLIMGLVTVGGINPAWAKRQADQIESHTHFATQDRRGTLHVHVTKDTHFEDQGLRYSAHLQATCGMKLKHWSEALYFGMESMCEFIPGSFKLNGSQTEIQFKGKSPDPKDPTRCLEKIEDFSFDVSLESGICSLEP